MADNLEPDEAVASTEAAPEQEETPVAAKKAEEPKPTGVVLAINEARHPGPFILSHLGLPDLLPEGTAYTLEQADEVQTLALKYGVPVYVKEQ